MPVFSRQRKLLVICALGVTLGVMSMTGCGSDGEPEPSAPHPPSASNVSVPAPRSTGPRPSGELTPDPSVVDVSPQRWNRVEPAADKRSLTVHFTLGMAPCNVLGRVDVDEGAETVTVTLQVGKLPGADCSQPQPPLVGPRTVVVALDSPLAGRSVVDGAA